MAQNYTDWLFWMVKSLRSQRPRLGTTSWLYNFVFMGTFEGRYWHKNGNLCKRNWWVDLAITRNRSKSQNFSAFYPFNPFYPFKTIPIFVYFSRVDPPGYGDTFFKKKNRVHKFSTKVIELMCRIFQKSELRVEVYVILKKIFRVFPKLIWLFRYR